MPDEDKAITLLQSINKEIAQVLNSIKEGRKDSNSMDSASIIKLEELLNQMKQVKEHITSFMNRYNKQTSLTDYTNL
jgi:hypothetical protein